MNFQKLWKPKILTVFLLLAFILQASLIRASTTLLSTVDRSELYLEADSSLGFSHDSEHYFLITVSSGFWNSSNVTVTMFNDQGRITFTMTNNTVLQTSHYWNEGVKVDVNGATAKSQVSAGTWNVTANSGDIVTIQWNISYEFILPTMVILGLIGLVGTFGGSVYSAHLIKKKQYRSGFITGVIWISICFPMFVAWLYSP